MPHGRGPGYPWVNENGESAWRLLILNVLRRGWASFVRRESEEEGSISVEVLDGQRHDVRGQRQAAGGT